MKTKPIAIDLFSGAGGLSEGLRQAGYRVIGAVEIDQLACATYRMNHKKVKLWSKDVRLVTGTEIMRDLKIKRGELDLLAACPPCQGFSSIRTKNGSKMNRDPRNNLIYDVVRIVRSLLPQSIMIENVPGLARSKKFSTFRRDLISLGYFVNWQVLNAADFGVPQRRKRLVLLASRFGVPAFAPTEKCHFTVRSAIGSMRYPKASSDPLHNYATNHSERVRELIKLIPRDGGSRKSLGRHHQLTCHQRVIGFNDVYGRMAWDRPSPTITGGCINPSKGRFLHPRQDRAITLREAALLQTFPENYKFSLAEGKYAAAVLIGNALPPEFIRRHALALKSITPGSERGSVRRLPH